MQNDPKPLRLMCVLAHPDDESLGAGGTIAKYAAAGVEVYLVTATRGERGWHGASNDYPGRTALGKMREAELRAAAQVLGIREVEFLDYVDGELEEVNPLEATTRIAAHVRRVKPRVVITFGPEGVYGHPDHIAVSQLTTGAVVAAADPSYVQLDAHPPHRVSKLYYKVWTRAEMAAYQSVFGDFVFRVGDEERQGVEWRDWAITTRLDTSAHWRTAWQAVLCHQSQLLAYGALLEKLGEEHHLALWGSQTFYRAYSLVNGGRALETDLFEGVVPSAE